MLTDILAGVICGLLMGTVSLTAIVYIFFTNRDLYDRLAKRLPQGIPPTFIMLSLVIGLPPTWAVWGAVAGALYNVALDLSPGAGLGSSNLIFTLAIICLAALVMLVALFLILRHKKWGLLLLSMSLPFVGIFAWLLPLIAHWR